MKKLKRYTLQFQIIVPLRLLIFVFLPEHPPPPSPLPSAYKFSRFCFGDISEIFKINYSICATANSLGQTVLISYQFYSRLNLECKLSHFSWKDSKHKKCKRGKHVRGQTRVTNSQAAAHESWLLRYSPCPPGFSRSNPHH